MSEVDAGTVEGDDIVGEGGGGTTELGHATAPIRVQH